MITYSDRISAEKYLSEVEGEEFSRAKFDEVFRERFKTRRPNIMDAFKDL
jgi:hypothetical protein